MQVLLQQIFLKITSTRREGKAPRLTVNITAQQSPPSLSTLKRNVYFYVLSFWKSQKESLLSARCGTFSPTDLPGFFPAGVIVLLVFQSAMLAFFVTFFFFLIPLVLNLELSKLREWKEPHRGYPATEDRDSVTAQSDTSTAAFQQCGGHCSCRCCSHPQAAAVLAETSPSDSPRDRRTAQRF